MVLCPAMKNQNTANAIHLQDLRVMSSDDEDCKFTTIGKWNHVVSPEYQWLLVYAYKFLI